MFAVERAIQCNEKRRPMQWGGTQWWLDGAFTSNFSHWLPTMPYEVQVLFHCPQNAHWETTHGSKVIQDVNHKWLRRCWMRFQIATHIKLSSSTRLCMAEVKIKEGLLDYKHECKIIGCSDGEKKIICWRLNVPTLENRSPQVAKHMLVLMVRGLNYSTWVPVCTVCHFRLYGMLPTVWTRNCWSNSYSHSNKRTPWVSIVCHSLH